MQNVSPDDQVALTKALTALAGTDIDLDIKVRILGLQLMNLVVATCLAPRWNHSKKK